MLEGVDGACEGTDGACAGADGARVGEGVEGVDDVGGRLAALGERRGPDSLRDGADVGGRLEPGPCVDCRPAGSLLARGRVDEGISGGGDETPDSLKMRR
jgi:hypothetical protein